MRGRAAAYALATVGAAYIVGRLAGAVIVAVDRAITRAVEWTPNPDR